MNHGFSAEIKGGSTDMFIPVENKDFINDEWCVTVNTVMQSQHPGDNNDFIGF
jgi:hypothetical protein|tara:strand:+ start:217 stop:375 length:159 start_codon:yes stop_codon:yes gene_type:complete